MKKLTALGIAVLLILATLTGCDGNEKIAWAKNLNISDIESIEAVRLPYLASYENEQYKNYEKAEFVRIVEIINSAKGKLQESPEQLFGGGICFYITLVDGTRHTFRNDGNEYLIIDGVSFKASYDWLSSWKNESLDSKVPDGFEY